MKTRLLVLLVLLPVVTGLALIAAWGAVAAEPQSISHEPVISSPTLHLNLGSTDPTVDPATVTDTRHLLVVNQLFLGLVRADEETGAPIPELATTWVMSPDATVFTFTLRSGLTWTDGNPLTAYDVRYGILRSLDPATQSESAYMLFYIQNGEQYNSGAITDTNQVGVTVLDYTHLRFALKQPAAFFPSTLAVPAARPMPAWAIAAHPTNWTEPANIVTNGAYRLTGWSHAVSMTLEKNPGYYDAANVQIERVSFSMVDDAAAWAMYQAGQLDSVVVPPGEWNAARSDPVLSPQLHAATRLGTYYYGFNTARAPFDALLVRKAFVAAVNRQGLIDLVAGRSDAGRYSTAQGLPLALTFTAPGVWGHVDGSAEGVGIPYDPVQARLWLAAASYPNGQGLPPITLVYDPHPVHQAVAEYIQQNWTDNLSVTVALSSTSSLREYYELLQTNPPQVWELRWRADHHDAYGFLRDGINLWQEYDRIWYGHWSNPTFESLLNLAARTADLNTRASLYQQAEEILVETDAVMLPIYYFANGMATRPYLQRTYGDSGFGARIADWRMTQPPSSVTIAGPTMGFVQTGYAFTATVSPITTTLPITYVWQAAGLPVVEHSGCLTDTVTYTWNTSGGQDISVTAANAGGTVTGTHLITVYTPVVAAFAAAPTSGLAPLHVTFTNTSSGDYTASLWDFGDSVTTTQTSPTHTYTAAGVYTVTLTTSGPGGSDTELKPGYITVRTEYDVYLPLVLKNY